MRERIEVDADQIDIAQAVRVHGGDVGGVVAHREDAGMHPGMERLDPAVEHLREAGELGHVLDRQAGVADGLGGAAGGQQFDAEIGEGAGEVDETGLVGDGKEGALHFGEE